MGKRFLAKTSRFADGVSVDGIVECSVTDIDHGKIGLIAAAHVGMELELSG